MSSNLSFPSEHFIGVIEVKYSLESTILEMFFMCGFDNITSLENMAMRDYVTKDGSEGRGQL